VKKMTYGFTVQRGGQQVRKFGYETPEAAADALARFRLGLDGEPESTPTLPAPVPASPSTMTFGGAAERYVMEKDRKKSIAEDRRILKLLKEEFGAGTPLSEITASRISAYKAKRPATKSRQAADEEQRLSAASINRPLALLRHLLHLAHEEWEILGAVPKIRLEKEPEHRIRWLEPDEEVRLLAALKASANPWAHPITVIALESGLRRGELLKLAWDRVDLSRGLIRLEVTKSGKRREVPMRQKVYEILSGLGGERTDRVWPVKSIRAAFEKAVAQAQIDNLVFHDTRHHFASWFVMNGGSLAALQQILGHRTLAMTMKYAHVNPQHLLAEIAKTEREAGQNQRMISTKLVEFGARADVASVTVEKG
jgi:integrase